MASPNEYYVAGKGVAIAFEPTETRKRAGFLSIDEGGFLIRKRAPKQLMIADRNLQGRHIGITVGDCIQFARYNC